MIKEVHFINPTLFGNVPWELLHCGNSCLDFLSELLKIYCKIITVLDVHIIKLKCKLPNQITACWGS